MSELPEDLRGDGPCKDCGTLDNIIWFTESVFWNAVVGGPGTMDDPGGILCIPCFVKRTDAAGFSCAWRLEPVWHWETHEERARRRAAGPCLRPSPSLTGVNTMPELCELPGGHLGGHVSGGMSWTDRLTQDSP